jgi:hypothetical protein
MAVSYKIFIPCRARLSPLHYRHSIPYKSKDCTEARCVEKEIKKEAESEERGNADNVGKQQKRPIQDQGIQGSHNGKCGEAIDKKVSFEVIEHIGAAAVGEYI